MPDINRLRDDFPLLRSSTSPVVYFDSACMSLKPQHVIDAMTEYYDAYPACAGRSGHSLGERVTTACHNTRVLIAHWIGAKNEKEIVFTRNTTEGINLIAHSLALTAGDIVLTTDKEHNSNLIPWLRLVKTKGIIHHVIPSNPDNTFNLDTFRSMMNDPVKLVSVGYTSNLDGVTVPLKEIIAIAHEYGALVLTDAAQAAPHRAIDVQDLDVDFLAFSGHKILGPTGTGVLYAKYELLERLEPFMVGGDTVLNSRYDGYEMLPPPEKFEAGLQDYAGIIGLGEAVQYLERVGLEAIEHRVQELNQFLTTHLLNIKGLRILGPQDPSLRSGIVNFTLDGFDTHQLAVMLERMGGIMVRSGQHCVHSWYAHHGIPGSVRASLYFYNTLNEAERFVDTMQTIARLS